eukprot:1464195-Rhodomonas_salina.1
MLLSLRSACTSAFRTTASIPCATCCPKLRNSCSVNSPWAAGSAIAASMLKSHFSMISAYSSPRVCFACTETQFGSDWSVLSASSSFSKCLRFSRPLKNFAAYVSPFHRTSTTRAWLPSPSTIPLGKLEIASSTRFSDAAGLDAGSAGVAGRESLSSRGQKNISSWSDPLLGSM